VWIDLFRERDTPAARRLRALIESDAPVALTAGALFELLCGTRSPDAAAFEQDLRSFPILRPSAADYRSAAELFRIARDSGQTVRAGIDCLIAATCIRTESLLLHSDSDFERLAACTPLRIFS
jgi:predicted nucleic acid-binding protein